MKKLAVPHFHFSLAMLICRFLANTVSITGDEVEIGDANDVGIFTRLFSTASIFVYNKCRYQMSVV